jgi:hypothetical protein
MRAAVAVALFLALLGLAACTSPEATRQRAGGAGADVGNRRPSLELHAGNQPYAGTPIVIPQLPAGDVSASPRGR